MNFMREVQHIRDECILIIFTVPKRAFKEQRVILNLKEFNKILAYHHFWMETFEAALNLIKPNFYDGFS